MVESIGSGLFTTSNTEENQPLTPQYYINFLIYSKDRPYQLSQLLESFFLMVRVDDCLEMKLNILYTHSPETPQFKFLYERLAEQYPAIQFHLEDGTSDQVISIIKQQPQERDGHELFPFFSIAVDDMIFFREISLFDCITTLQEQNKAYALHLKLSPGICYSHTNNKLMHCPTFEPILKQGQQLSQLRFLRFRRSETELDWNYPFDFCGSIYRKEQIDKLLTKLDPEKLLKPNSFELAGNQAIRLNMLAKDYPYCICMNAPTMTVITINKVQNLFNNPVYDCGKGQELVALNGFFEQGKKINLDYYRANQFNTVHIGEFVTEPLNLAKPKLAVVMPVFNQRPFYFREAVESILRQSYTGEVLLIIVDDGSTEPKLLELLEKYSKDPRVISLKNPNNMGVAHSLNTAIDHASQLDPPVKYIARMDSDDISLRERLLTQVNYLELNSSVDICGTAMIVLRQNLEPKIVSPPTLNPLIKFALTFYCSLGHPTIMFRASKANIIHYEVEGPHQLMEDYALWMKLAASGEVQFANIGQSLVGIRKHLENQSTGVPIEAEIPLKQQFLQDLVGTKNPVLSSFIQQEPLICEEFIRVTGRPVRSDTFFGLKHRAEIDMLFKILIARYNKQQMLATTSQDSLASQFILRSLEDRKHELAIHAVSQNCDVEALRGLAANGGQGISQLKKLLMGGTAPTPKKTNRN